MKLRAKLVVRILVAVAAIVLSGAAAFIIKETLAYRNPESALPVVHVNHNGEGLPAQYVVMDGFTWQFLTKVYTWEQPDGDLWRRMEFAPVMPSETLDIKFSFDPGSMTVWRAPETSETFEEVRGVLVEEDNSLAASARNGDYQMFTPASPGKYTYKVEAEWGKNRRITLYFRLWVMGVAENKNISAENLEGKAEVTSAVAIAQD